MPDMEKVIKGLEDSFANQGCGYMDGVGELYAVSGEDLQNAIALLKEQPEIVRCKDCKKRPDEHTTELNGELYRYCELHRRWTTDDWFCADGERAAKL